MGILIADENRELYTELIECLGIQKVACYTADDSAAAQKFLKNHDLNIEGIIISTEISNPDFLSLIKSASYYRKKASIVLVKSGEIELEEKTLEKVIMYERDKFPSVKDMLYWFCPDALNFDKEQAIELGKSNPDQLEKEFVRSDIFFSQFSSKLIFPGKVSLFDVYVQINNDKYIKILESGQAFDKDRVDSYKEKGVKNFYVPREALELYFHYCDKMINKIQGLNNIADSSKKVLVLEQGEFLYDVLTDLGINEKSLYHARNYVSKLQTLVGSIQRSNKGTVLDRFSDYHHSLGVTAIGSLVAQALGIRDEKSLEDLGIACYYHDIGLFVEKENIERPVDLEIEFDEEEILKLLESEDFHGPHRKYLQGVYDYHPEKGAEVLRAIKGISEFVPQIVSQHHCYADKASGKDVGTIHPLSGVLEISNDFMLISKKYHRKEISIHVFRNQVQKIVTKFPQRISTAFIKVFMGKN